MSTVPKMNFTRTASRARKLLTLVSVGALAATGLVLGVVVAPLPASADVLLTPAPVEQRSADAVTADPLPTVQIDSGVVWTQEIVGNTVYAGGSFSKARPAGAAGTNLTSRSNLLAYDITTGALKTSFAPVLNGQVKVVRKSPDGTKIYVGGAFTTADGQPRFNLAAYSTSTGALITKFKPAIGGSYVNAIAVTDTVVYIGGLFTKANGVSRTNLAALDATTGGLKGWAPITDRQVDAMVMAPGNTKVIVGGRFATVNSTDQRGLVALDLSTGAILPWIAPSIVVNGWSTAPAPGKPDYRGKAGIFSLSTDGVSIFGTGWVYATPSVGNLEGTFSAQPGSGAINWVEDCHGDTYGAFSNGTTVYTISHAHACESVGGFPQATPAPGNVRHAVAFTAAAKGTLSRSPSAGSKYKDWSGTPAPAVVDWFPDWVTGTGSGQGQAGWAITGNASYVVVGGEFPYVNGKLQQGLVRFAIPSISGSKEPPRLASTRWVPTAQSPAAGSIQVSIGENWDRDDMTLTYEITRSGRSTPVYTTTAMSTFWDLGSVTYTDTGLTPGASYTYRVRAIDPNGNISTSAPVTATATPEPVAHAAPVAAFTSTVNGNALTVDASTTATSDGASIASVSWNWGDGTPDGSGINAGHTYTGGTYVVTTTVTDSQGSIGTASRSVVIAGSPVAAADAFDRTVAGGWGSADIGGTWTGTTGFSVAGGSGLIKLTGQSQTRSTVLPGVNESDVNLQLQFSIDKVAGGDGILFAYSARKTDAGEYRVKLLVASTGVVTVQLAKKVGSTESLLGTVALPGTYTAGQLVSLRLQVVGSGTASLSAKVWPSSDPEPAIWAITATDATPALQTPGQIAMSVYLTKNATGAPVVVSVDNLSVTRP